MLFDRYLDARNRLFAKPQFQRWAARFPLTRWIAHRRARGLFDLCAGFVYSQVLLACVRVNLFDVLAAGPQPLPTLAEKFSLTPEATARLLAAAVSLRLVERRSKNRFGLGELGIAMVGNTALAAMVEHHSLLYADLHDPLALLRGEGQETRLAGYWPYGDSEQRHNLAAERVEEYTTLMAASQPLVSSEVLDSYSLDRHRCLLDVGGGDGSFLTAAAARAPHLRLMLFDLPPVADRARERIAAAGLADRATAFGGDFLRDPLPIGADIVSLVRVLHDHDDDAALTLLRAVRKALPADGVLLLAEPMSETAGAEPMGDAYFGFYLLAMGRGQPRNAEQLTALLTQAGFQKPRPIPTGMPLQTSLMLARPG
ncbi:MAG: methyltransferase [Rhodocyclaceae bacterium]